MHPVVSPMKKRACCALALLIVTLSQNIGLAAAPQMDADGTIHVPAFVLPESSLLNDETRTALKYARESPEGHDAAVKAFIDGCPIPKDADRAAMAKIRIRQAEIFYSTPFYRRLREHFPVVMTAQTIGGVYTEVFTPEDGIAPRNRDRVLIDLHGGHFQGGARIVSHVESIPIASIGKIKVICIDYRMAPEYAFPAASEDVAVVYREIIKTYEPRNIGLYGSSAGGLLTAESIAWFQKEGLPLPGAVGMLCGAARYYQEGDSGLFASAREGFTLVPSRVHPYFESTDVSNPLAFPGLSTQAMAKFPPSLLVATTRDVALSSVVVTHSQLVRLGVDAELHVWEGLGHTFYTDPDLPESREVHDVVIGFFDRHLGK